MKFSLLLSIGFLSATAGLAQSPSKVISQANKALGGEKALKAVSSWQQSGTITRVSDGATGKYSSMAGGGLYGGMYDLGGFEVAFGYNGKSGWMRDSKAGLRTVTGDASKDFQAEAAYRNSRWLKAKDEKAKIAAGGISAVAGKQTNVILLTTAKAVRIKLYFDTVSGLLLREEIPQGKSFDYSDYRAVGGVQTPFAIKYAEGEESYDIKLEDVKYNVAIAKTSFDFPKLSDEPLPDIPSLLTEIRANADKNDAILENYGYTELRTERDMNDKGVLIEKSSEKRLLTFYKGRRIRRTVEKNGKQLSPSDQAKEDKEVEKQIAEIEKEIAQKEKKAAAAAASGNEPKDEPKRFTIADTLKNSLLINPRRERFRGRDVIVFDFEPNPAAKPKTINEKIIALCTGAIWVDAGTKQVVRLEGYLTKTTGSFLVKAKRGASFAIENEIVNNEIWLPAWADFNFQVKLVFVGLNINNVIKYGDYRRFETEVKDAAVGDEKKPE